MLRAALAANSILILIASFILAPGGLLIGQATAATPQQATAFLPGFPRTELGGINFGSPTVFDLNGDGALEVLIGDAAGCVWGWNSAGQVLPKFPLTTVGDCRQSARINGSLAVGDINGDGKPEIVAGTRGLGFTPGQLGRVFVWRADGTLLPGWPREVAWNPNGNQTAGAEVYGVALANVIGDTRLEIVAGTSNNTTNASDCKPSNPNDCNTGNLYVFYDNGQVLSGFPTSYRTAGIFGGLGAGDLNSDGLFEPIVGRDHLYIHAYSSGGSSLSGWPVRTYLDPSKTSFDTDMYIEFTQNVPAIGDLDLDGKNEIVIAGKVRDPNNGRNTVASTVMVIQPDGTRRSSWRIPPMGGSWPTNEFLPQQGPALADLDGNGTLEIIVTLFDGTARAYREDATLLWTYNFAQGRRLFGSDPVVGDITGDGRPDIVFGTYSPDGSANANAGVVALDASGKLVSGFPLALTQEGSATKQGIRAAPTLTDLNRDGQIDLLAGSQAGVLYAWSLGQPYNAKNIPWPTGRQNNARTGAVTRSNTQGQTPRYRTYLAALTR